MTRHWPHGTRHLLPDPEQAGSEQQHVLGQRHERHEQLGAAATSATGSIRPCSARWPPTRRPTWAISPAIPHFVAPRDPRPVSDGPATFLLDANFGLTATSAAINNALESVATTTDFLGNPENPNPTTKGFHLPGYGPRDVGAFEFEPVGTTGTTAVGGTFRVVTTSLVPDGGTQANGSTLYVYPAPTSVIVDFSRR